MNEGFGVRNESSVGWLTDPPDEQWDSWLADLEGHPLQSALWGSARYRAEGIKERRFAALVGGVPVCMARVEERRLPIFGKAAWIPKGPVYRKGVQVDALHEQLTGLLRQAGFWVVLENPYRPDHVASGWKYRKPAYKTLIVDIDKDNAEIWSSFASKLRSQIKSPEKKGVVVEQTRDPERVAEFYRLCTKISQGKGFDLPGSEQLMQLLLRGEPDAPISSQLFSALHEGKLITGYLSISTAGSIHNIWSGYDRDQGISGASDLVVWRLMEWAMAQKIKCYDQEGIDPEGNPSTYAFKKKFGGVETDLPGLMAYPLSGIGKLMLMVGHRLNKI
jgi:lipid II:glycine glycyltransferase (peptidoglycan interpeptide bridge formation enzyme)